MCLTKAHFYFTILFIKTTKEKNMNIQEADILNNIYQNGFTNQRVLAENCGHSLGMINQGMNELIKSGYLTEEKSITKKAKKVIEDNSPKRAVILAAGFGMRMVPINTETPKAMLEVKGEVLIERIIEQLHASGIKDIVIVVGFMKEQFEYLIDKYGVELVVNQNYASTNNLHSLALFANKLERTYIIPSDIYCEKNPFNKTELYSWYMVSSEEDTKSDVRINRKRELVKRKNDEIGNRMIGIAYITENKAKTLKDKIEELSKDKNYDNSFWEETLYEKDKMIVEARISNNDIYEINTYEQLREIDSNSNQLNSDAIKTAAKALNVNENDIVNIKVLKKGMTNRSFLFMCKDETYIMRIPGEGSENLINRREEADVYNTIKDKGICDDIVYINPDNGFKITKYIANADVCDAYNRDDVVKCMKVLRNFHNQKLKVKHEFNIFKLIDYYESLWGNIPSAYRDYTETKKNVKGLKKYIDGLKIEKSLTHIDAVPDNFMIKGDDIRLIDWEYAGMQDPHVDVAMFCIYALYDKEHIDNLIDIYFENKCDEKTRTKIYCYIAMCGLLWSNWCEYKRNLGVEFGEYSLKQYRYAKEFYKIAEERIKNE